MFSHSRLLAAVLAASAAVLASPAPAADTTTASLQPTDAWVSVGSAGVAQTITPVLTTISGTPTVLSAKPTTSGTATSSVPPEATATSGAGSFPVCSNVDGDLAPFCAPSNGSTLHPGATYYVTWDASYFAAAPNTTVLVTGNLFNATSGAVTTQAFSSNTLAAAWSFYAWTVDSALLKGATSAGVHMRISLSYIDAGNSSAHVAGPIITVANPEPYRQKPAKAPTGAALYIGLPCVLGFVAIMLVGTCIWNRRARRIGLGNVMSRSRFGELGMGRSRGYGVGKSRRQRVGAVNLDSKDAIDLQNREAAAAAAARRGGDGSGARGHADDYDDFGMAWSNTDVGRGPSSPYVDAPARPRRDSDALGSLAGTPTDERFGEHRPPTARGEPDSGSTGNVFRDELRRQQNGLI